MFLTALRPLPTIAGVPGTHSTPLLVDTDHLGRILAASLPAGVRAAELFIESRLTLGIEVQDADRAPESPRVERSWETGAHLRRFSEGRHESFVLDAPEPGTLEALALHPQAVTVDWLSDRPKLGVPPAPTLRPEARLDQAAPSTETGPWSSSWLTAALGTIEGWLAGLRRHAAGAGFTTRTTASLEARIQEILVLATGKDPARDTRPSLDATLHLEIARHGARSEARETLSARSLDDLAAMTRGDTLSRLFERAVEGLDAETPPSGIVPVIFASPSGGFLLHEICGHLLEADHILRGDSPFVASRGCAIAPAALTLADDGSMAGMRGSLLYDDEGIAARRTPLILQGTLVGFLSDRLTAHATQGISTGNGRRQSYRDAPMPRMTNLVIEPGPLDPAEILAGTSSGLYVTRLGRGRVDPATGRFALAVEEGYRLVSGRVDAPVRGAVLHGRAADLLQAIDAIGNDPKADRGAPLCVKGDQAVAFGIMQPTLRIGSMTVSGPDR